jgi:hypothetical protein
MTRHTLAIAAVTVFVLAGAVSYAQEPAAGTANPELVGTLAKELGSTPQQAEGAAGALFGLAKTKLDPQDWSKVASAVPGMDGLLKAAPAAGSAPGGVGPTGTAGTAATSALTSAAGMGGLSSVAGSFSKLGLKPEMVTKAVPVLTNFVSKSGGADVGQLLAGALK